MKWGPAHSEDEDDEEPFDFVERLPVDRLPLREPDVEREVDEDDFWLAEPDDPDELDEPEELALSPLSS